MNHRISSSAFADTKPHYELLDGLRGVAALLVVFYHIFEGFSFAGGGTLITVVNHGYLAVDFFFILSGFVIGYAYDDRWKKNMTLKGFFKRRLIRLHPNDYYGGDNRLYRFLCARGSEMGWYACSYLRGYAGTLACNVLLFRLIREPGMMYAGTERMFSLNGPSWSLFFEYIGNILYALFIHRLSNKALTVLVILLGLGLSWFALFDVVGYGMIGVGWTLDGQNFWGGMLRMLFPFTLGMLISRNFRPFKIRGAFLDLQHYPVGTFLCALYRGKSPVCLNGVFEMICIAVVFPLLVCMGASGKTTDKQSTAICKFLGDISYPLYAIHYPIMYVFYSWLIKKQLYTLEDTWPVAAVVYFGSIALAYLCLKLYDEPVRRWLGNKFVK